VDQVLRPRKYAIDSPSGRNPLGRLQAALAAAWEEEPTSACFGLFAACDALGVGHVLGAPVHVYVWSKSPELLERLGLVVVAAGESPDVTLQVAAEASGLDKTLRVNTVKRRTHSLFNQGVYFYGALPMMKQHRLEPSCSTSANSSAPNPSSETSMQSCE
jgi:hypothetical protein